MKVLFQAIILALTLPNMLSAKTLTAGVALRFGDKYNDTISYFDKGFETAKSLFEKEHPNVIIQLKKFPHDTDMLSVQEAGDRIIKAKVPAVVGGEMSTEALALGDKLNPEKIVLVSHTASSPIVTDNKPYVFRAGFADEQVARALAKFVVEKLKPKKIGIFANISSPYSEYLSKEFSREVMALAPGIPEIPIEKVLNGTEDYTKNIDALKAAGVTHLVSFVVDGNFTNLVVQSGRKNFFPVFIGSDSWGSNRFVLSRYVENSSKGDQFIAYRSYYWKEDAKGGMAEKFRKEFTQKYHDAPNAWNAIAFDSAWVLFTAMNRAKNPKSSDQIRNELVRLKDIHLVTSDHFSFSDHNAALKDIPIYKVSRAGIEFEGTIQ